MIGKRTNPETPPARVGFIYRLSAALSDYEAFVTTRAGEYVVVTTKPQGGERVITCRVSGEVLGDAVEKLGWFTDGPQAVAAKFRAWQPVGGAA